MTFAYASLVTHQLFRTDPRDMTKNNTSSYLDLSVLYGINQDQQNMVRNKESGMGLLWPDSFAEDRLILVPPSSVGIAGHLQQEPQCEHMHALLLVVY